MRNSLDLDRTLDLADKDEAKDHIAPLPRVSIQAFCETPDLFAVINEAVVDRRMARTHAKVNMGGGHAAVEAYKSAPTPNVIVIETISDRADLLASLAKLAEFCDAGTKVVVIGRVNDIVLYRELMSRGVSDYLVAPLNVLDFVRALSNLYHDASSEPVGRVIAVTGAKGGVGASTIAHNVGWCIAKTLEMQTVIADLDLAYGTAGLDFNQDPPQGVAEAVYAPDRLDTNLVDRLLSKCTDRLSILAAPATLDRTYDLGETAFDALIDILRATVPCVVIDLPHQWTAWSRRLLVAADEVMLVAAPDLANLRNAKNMLDSIRAARPNDSRPKLVLNGVGLVKRPEIAAADFAKSIEFPPIATIPFDAKLFGTAANNGQMIGELGGDSKIAEQMVDIARAVTGRAEVRKAKKSLLDPIMGRLKKAS